MWGNTTTSRSGSSARSRGVEGKGVCPDMGILGLSAEDGPHTGVFQPCGPKGFRDAGTCAAKSEEHTSELQSPCNLVCRLLLEKKKKNIYLYAASDSRTSCMCAVL